MEKMGHPPKHYRKKHRRQGEKGWIPWTVATAAVVLCLWLGMAALRSWPTGGAPEGSAGEPGEDFRPEVGEPPYTIVVDAGHGGNDPGAIGFVVERDMTAATADALVELLEADPNYLPVGTREDYETTATPMERVQRANQQNPDLLISIHGNSSTVQNEASGFEVYPITPGRNWHRESLYFARILTKSIQETGSALRGQGGVRYLYYENGIKVLAEANDTEFREDETFTILEQANCPAVLAEQCFVTNQEDVDRLGDADGCQLAAEMYYQAICTYFGTQPLNKSGTIALD